MKKLSNTEAELKKSVAYKKKKRVTHFLQKAEPFVRDNLATL